MLRYNIWDLLFSDFTTLVISCTWKVLSMAIKLGRTYKLFYYIIITHYMHPVHALSYECHKCSFPSISTPKKHAKETFFCVTFALVVCRPPCARHPPVYSSYVAAPRPLCPSRVVHVAISPGLTQTIEPSILAHHASLIRPRDASRKLSIAVTRTLIASSPGIADFPPS